MRIIEVPDFHYSPKWSDESLAAAKAVAKTAKDTGAALIAVPGDLYDAPIMVTDKGGINILRQIIRMWRDVCPVVAIEGTPSHDGPGCYGPLEDLGLVLLRPNKMYGLYGKNVLTVTPGTSIEDPYLDLLLFGVPELDKHNVQAKLALPADQANGLALDLFAQYVEAYMAPMRAMYPDVPALALLHGNVSDARKENTSDIILRASDIVIHTEMLEVAGINRWALGHIHTPWESQVIFGGYGGFNGLDSNPWGKRDFVPAMNVVDIKEKRIERVPYGTPKRVKIFKPLSKYDPSIAYWLVSKDPEYRFPEGMHPWSRITYDETRTETRRVTAEQAADVRKLSDLFRLIDPKVTDSIIELVDTIPESRASTGASVDIRMTGLEVKGCVFFHGKDVMFDLASLQDGVTAIVGNNGSGKSSLLAFCTPYPLVVGKDTSSGRISAIKDFFSSKDSMIRKTFLVNGAKHEHLITIKGAHTQNPKTECYLTIDGEPQLDCGTFDEMMETCEALYGPFSDYRLTTFYEQPLQSPKSTSSLMSASMTDIRNLVQNIAGIDREAEKRYALDRLAQHDSEATRLSSWIVGAEAMIEDTSALRASIEELEQSKREISAKMHESEMAGLDLKDRVRNLQAAKAASDAEERRYAEDRRTAGELARANADLDSNITKIQGNVGRIAEIREALEANERAEAEVRRIDSIEQEEKKAQWSWDERSQEIRRMERDHEAVIAEVQSFNRRAMDEYTTRKGQLTRDADASRAAVESHKRKIESLDNPCPQCGYRDPQAVDLITANEEAITKLKAHIERVEADIASLAQPVDKPAPDEPSELIDARKVLGDRPTFVPQSRPVVLSTFEVNLMHQELADAKDSDQKIGQLRERIKANEEAMAKLQAIEYGIDETVATRLEEAERSYSDERRRWQELNGELASANGRIDALNDRIKKSEAQASEIEEARKKAARETAKADSWKYISSMLMPNKIPALELELMLDSIDAEASRIIEPYHEGRFMVRTETQSEGKAGSVDRFDIMVYDAESGEERSFMKHSPGQKAFFSDAYVKALVRQRNERSMRSYAPVIMDESDGPIQPELVGQYYEMQRRYWDIPVLVVSHSPASHEHIIQHIDIEEVKK